MESNLKFFRLILALLSLASATAFAQQYPTKPVRIVLHFPAGGSTDVVTRILAQALTESMGQPFVVENKLGADGAIAAAQVIQSPPDGYTLFVATNTAMMQVPLLKKDPPCDPVTAFTPIPLVGRYTFVLVVAANFPTPVEAGMPPINVEFFAALSGPAKLPAEIATRLSKELSAIITRPQIREQIDKQGFALAASTPEELRAFVKQQLGAWSQGF